MMGLPVRVIATSEIFCLKGTLLRAGRTADRRLMALNGLQAFCMVADVALLQLGLGREEEVEA